jgi:hypothetical protein
MCCWRAVQLQSRRAAGTLDDTFQAVYSHARCVQWPVSSVYEQDGAGWGSRRSRRTENDGEALWTSQFSFFCTHYLEPPTLCE